jgi:hypothetical protein
MINSFSVSVSMICRDEANKFMKRLTGEDNEKKFEEM